MLRRKITWTPQTLNGSRTDLRWGGNWMIPRNDGMDGTANSPADLGLVKGGRGGRDGIT